MIRIVRVLAPNPGVYTLEGTNTWVVGCEPSVVIDPGPADETHLAEVERVAVRVSAVVITHDHEDHAEGAAAFADSVGAPLRAWRMRGAERLRDGELHGDLRRLGRANAQAQHRRAGHLHPDRLGRASAVLG